MPEREVHNFFNTLLLGEDFDRLNRDIDLPAKYFGYRHRKYLHGGMVIKFLMLYDRKAALAAFLHQRLDFDKQLAGRVKLIMALRDEGII